MLKRCIPPLLLFLMAVLLSACSLNHESKTIYDTTPSETSEVSAPTIVATDENHDESRNTEAIETAPTLGIEDRLKALSMEEILANAEYREALFAQPDFDILDYDEATILSYPELLAYYLEHVDFTLSEVTMEQTPESTCFCEIGYSQIRNILVVTFRSSGDTYLYFAFPEAEWERFVSADSLGGYYNQNIKNHYDCEKL